MVDKENFSPGSWTVQPNFLVCWPWSAAIFQAHSGVSMKDSSREKISAQRSLSRLDHQLYVKVEVVWRKDTLSGEWLNWLVRDSKRIWLKDWGQGSLGKRHVGRPMGVDMKSADPIGPVTITPRKPLGRYFFTFQTNNSWLRWTSSISFQEKDVSARQHMKGSSKSKVTVYMLIDQKAKRKNSYYTCKGKWHAALGLLLITGAEKYKYRAQQILRGASWCFHAHWWLWMSNSTAVAWQRHCNQGLRYLSDEALSYPPGKATYTSDKYWPRQRKILNEWQRREMKNIQGTSLPIQWQKKVDLMDGKSGSIPQ